MTAVTDDLPVVERSPSLDYSLGLLAARTPKEVADAVGLAIAERKRQIAVLERLRAGLLAEQQQQQQQQKRKEASPPPPKAKRKEAGTPKAKTKEYPAPPPPPTASRSQAATSPSNGAAVVAGTSARFRSSEASLRSAREKIALALHTDGPSVGKKLQEAAGLEQTLFYEALKYGSDWFSRETDGHHLKARACAEFIEKGKPAEDHHQ